MEASFNASADAQILRKAMKGIGTDEDALITILCNRTLRQRFEIKEAFKEAFGKDLMQDVKYETSGRFGQVLVGLLTPRFDYLAKTLRDEIDRREIKIKNTAVVDIIFTSSNEDIDAIKAAYGRMFHSSLEEDICKFTSGHFRRVLTALLNGDRDLDIDDEEEEADTEAKFNAGEVFHSILPCQDIQGIRVALSKYEKTHGRGSIEVSVKREFSGDIQNAMLAIVKCVMSPAAYFADRLRNAMVGLGTDDDTLMFILISRCEIDLESIKEEYEEIYGKSLGREVKSETSGDYGRAVMRILNPWIL